MNKEAAAGAGDALAGSDIRSGGASREQPHVACTLKRSLQFENTAIAEIILAPPSTSDVAELGLDLIRVTRCGAGFIHELDRALIEKWFARLANVPIDVIRALPLDDGNTLLLALKIQLARSVHLAVKN